MKKILLLLTIFLTSSTTAYGSMPEIPQSQIDELNKLTPLRIDEGIEISTFFSDDFNAMSARVEFDAPDDRLQIISDMIGANRNQIRQEVCASPLGNLLTEKYGIFKFKYYSTSGKYMRAVVFSC